MSDNNKTPKQVLEAASLRTRRVVEEILVIEHEYQSYRNLGAVASVEKEIAARIKQLIEREVKR